MEKRINNRILWALPVFAAIVWLVASVKLLGLTAAAGVLFLCFLFFGVFIPGFNIVSNWKALHTLKEVALFSFGVGILIIYILYFALAPFGLNRFIPLCLACVSVLSIVLLLFRIKRKKVSLTVKASFDILSFFACLIGLVLTFVILSMANLEPDLVGARPYYHDTLNGVGLTVAAYKSFPMESLQMSGWVFPYHLGYYIFTSVLMSALQVSAFVAVMKLSLIFVSPLCILAFNCVAERIGMKQSVAGVLSILFAVVPSCTFMHYLYIDTIGFPFGLYLCFVALLLFSIAQNEGSKINKYHVFASAFLSAAMIAKGPLTVTYLFGICFVLLVELIRKKNYWVFAKGLLYAVPCLGLYLLVYGNGAGDSMSLSFFYSAIRTDFSYSIYQKYPDWLFKTLSVLYYSSTMTITTTISLIVVAIGIFTEKHENVFRTFSISSVLCGMVLMNILKQAGSSEVYFLTGVYPICFLSAVYVVGRLLDNEHSRIYKLLALCAVTAYLFLGLPQDARASMKIFIGDDATVESQASALKAAQTYSIQNYREGKTPDPSIINGAIITPGQYEAYLWLRDNTPEDAIFSDYRYSTNNKFFCASVFSQRSCYLEGWGYLTMEDSNNNTDEKIRRDTIVRFFNDTRQESFCLLLAQEGVEYLIFEKVITGDWELSDTYVDEIFRNDDVIIYHIRPVEWH